MRHTGKRTRGPGTTSQNEQKEKRADDGGEPGEAGGGPEFCSEKEVDVEGHGLGVPEEERRMQRNGNFPKGHGHEPSGVDEET